MHRYPPLVYLLDPEIRPLVLRMLQDDSELLNLRYELAVLRARFLQMANESTDKDLSGLARAITNLAEAVHTMEQEKHMYVHIAVVGLVLQAVGQVAAQYIAEDKRLSFSADLKDAVRKLLPDTTVKSIASSALVTQVSEAL